MRNSGQQLPVIKPFAKVTGRTGLGEKLNHLESLDSHSSVNCFKQNSDKYW